MQKLASLDGLNRNKSESRYKRKKVNNIGPGYVLPKRVILTLATTIMIMASIDPRTHLTDYIDTIIYCQNQNSKKPLSCAQNHRKISFRLSRKSNDRRRKGPVSRSPLAPTTSFYPLLADFFRMS